MTATTPEITETREPEEIQQEFLTAMGQAPSEENRALYARLIVEETKEVREAIAHLLKEMIDLDYVSHAYRNLGGSVEDLHDLIAPHINLDLCLNLYDQFPPELERIAFIRVHQSNMSKLGEDGKPIRREDGKVLKSKNYVPPQLEDLVSGPEVLH